MQILAAASMFAAMVYMVLHRGTRAIDTQEMLSYTPALLLQFEYLAMWCNLIPELSSKTLFIPFSVLYVVIHQTMQQKANRAFATSKVHK